MPFRKHKNNNELTEHCTFRQRRAIKIVVFDMTYQMKEYKAAVI